MLNVLVTGIGSGGLGEQTLKALRLASSSNYKLFGSDINSFNNSKLVDISEQVPPASSPSYINSILNLCRKWDINILIPGSEQELSIISSNRELFKDRNIHLPINAGSIIKLCMDKAKLNRTLSMLGYKVPKYLEVYNSDQLNTIDFFPVVVKPKTGGRGSSDVFLAQSRDQLLALSQYLDLLNGNKRFIIQEYVGTSQDEYTVGILHDRNGQFIDGIALHRDLSKSLSVNTKQVNTSQNRSLGDYLVISSGVSQGRIGAYPEITRQCRQIADSLGSCGPLNIQCRFVDGQVNVFEINPRYSGTTSLRAMVGFNEPDLLIRHDFLNEDVPRNQLWQYSVIDRSLVEQINSELPNHT